VKEIDILNKKEIKNYLRENKKIKKDQNKFSIHKLN
jgi:hypothetical protein